MGRDFRHVPTKGIQVLRPATLKKRRLNAPIAVDLFAGAGGLAEGLESTGVRVAVASELHPQAALTHAFNHPGTRVIFGDIRKLTTRSVLDLVEEMTGSRVVDLVVGGPPCQGFSTAGKKIKSDPRNSLFHEFVRFVEEARPRMFLLENVPGFKKMHGGAAFEKASSLLGGLGYELQDTILDASHYGVPQRRKRFVLVGRLPAATAPFSWPTPTHEAQSSCDLLPLLDSPALEFVSAEQALEDIAFLEPGWEAHRHGGPAFSGFQEARRAGCELLFNHLATRHRARAVEMFAWISEGGTIASVPASIRSAKRTMARLDRKQISNAVLALPDDLIHYRHPRIPSVREMARLQTFDDDFVFFGKRTSGFVERRVDVPQYTQVGNAVPPLLARALGESLVASLAAEVCDLREIDLRRKRHSWVQGSSAFSGYTLSKQAQGKLDLIDVEGEPCLLPISKGEASVCDAQALFEWKKQPSPRRGQWAPGVQPKSTPAHTSK